MKLFVFLAIVVSLWYVMRWLQQAEVNRRVRQNRSNDNSKRSSFRNTTRATDTIVCPRCGAYVPAEFPTACDRSDCPYPGVG
jgi:hypothetical protein